MAPLKISEIKPETDEEIIEFVNRKFREDINILVDYLEDFQPASCRDFASFIVNMPQNHREWMMEHVPMQLVCLWASDKNAPLHKKIKSLIEKQSSLSALESFLCLRHQKKI